MLMWATSVSVSQGKWSHGGWSLLLLMWATSESVSGHMVGGLSLC